MKKIVSILLLLVMILPGLLVPSGHVSAADGDMKVVLKENFDYPDGDFRSTLEKVRI